MPVVSGLRASGRGGIFGCRLCSVIHAPRCFDRAAQGGSGMFADRIDAGRQLAAALHSYRSRSPIVLAIPRGGVIVGREVAAFLDAELSIIISRKLPYPDNPEAGFGAVAEDGSIYLIPGAEYDVPDSVRAAIIAEQRQVVERALQRLRGGAPLPELTGRTVILVDDGIAMGSTMRAAVICCRNHQAATIVVAAPVAGPQVVRELRQHVDDVVVLLVPRYFRAVAQAYQRWWDVSDEEALAALEHR